MTADPLGPLGFDADPEETARDDVPPSVEIVPCRSCLDMGVGFTFVYGFKIPCPECGRVPS